MRLRTRAQTTALTTALAALLAGCGTSVKLDETPIETRTPTAVSASTGPGTATARAGTTTPAAPQSQVATVDLSRGAAAGSSTVAGAGASAVAAPTGRVVFFDFDSFVVKDDFRGLLESHAKALNATKTRRMTVEGHTDERGGSEYNLALGQKRAEAVVKTLALLGVGESQLEAVSFGKERPADTGHDEAAWAKNRRAELKDR
ncbi:peptidoglycan-associated lipoprotein Pal [Aquabacterium sp. OR-4]|nr:peptidoglycan-associated lipoprotein Pal [Aquabacterium sp. OR-4]MDT7836251.1 peptidoglycan-associated lipoprotein Pal [Aquabacterium sp. OR-4]